jgi:hypothetical protein
MFYENSAQMQDSFDPNLSLFNDAFGNLDNIPMDQYGQVDMNHTDSMEALSLPGFQNFVHTHF